MYPRSLFHTETQQVVSEQLQYDYPGVGTEQHKIHSDPSNH